MEGEKGMLKFSKYKITKKHNKLLLILLVKMASKARMENRGKVEKVVIMGL